MGYIFGAGTDAKSPEDLKRRREIAQALMMRTMARPPRNVGEGLSAVGAALAARGMNQRADEAEKAGNESFQTALGAATAPRQAEIDTGEGFGSDIAASLAGKPRMTSGGLQGATTDQLTGLASHPFAPKGMTPVLAAMLGKRLDPETQRPVALSPGAVLVDPATGKQIAAGAEKPLGMQDRAVAAYMQQNPGATEFDALTALRKAGATSVNVAAPQFPDMSFGADAAGHPRLTMGQAVAEAPKDEGKLGETLSKADAALMGDMRSAAVQADDIESLANQIEVVAPEVGYTGPGGELIGRVDDVLDITGTAGARGAFRGLAMKSQLAFTELTKGAITDREMGQFKIAAAGMHQTPEANKAIAEAMRAGAQRTKMRASFYERWVGRHKTMTGANDAWSRYMRENPIIAKAEGGGLAVNEIKDPTPYLTGAGGAGDDLPPLPQGVSQRAWQAMTPEERALWGQ